MNYELRPALWEDNAFLEELYCDVHAGEFAMLGLSGANLAQLLGLQFKAQRTGYAAQFPEADDSIVWAGAYRIGRVLLNVTDTEVRLVDIALLSAFRGSGVGTSIVEQLQVYARESGVPLRLSVRSQNPARRLYERLGFAATAGEGELSVAMQWSARPKA